MVASPNSIQSNGEERVIELKDGGPWGFRLGGGAEFGCPLQVAKVSLIWHVIFFPSTFSTKDI